MDVRYILPLLAPFCLILSLGINALKKEKLQLVFLMVIIIVFMYSNYNIYTLRQWHNPAQVSPWKQITNMVRTGYSNDDVILLPAWESNLFRRYFKPSVKEKIEYYVGTSKEKDIYCLEDKGILSTMENDIRLLIPKLLRKYHRIWLLLSYRDKGFEEEEQWIRENTLVEMEKGYQLEEHTFQGLREGVNNIHKYKSYLYKIFLISKR